MHRIANRQIGRWTLQAWAVGLITHAVFMVPQFQVLFLERGFDAMTLMSAYDATVLLTLLAIAAISIPFLALFLALSLFMNRYAPSMLYAAPIIAPLIAVAAWTALAWEWEFDSIIDWGTFLISDWIFLATIFLPLFLSSLWFTAALIRHQQAISAGR